MSDIARRAGTAVARTDINPYTALGAKLDQQGIYLAFSKGEYIYGPNKEELRLGAKLVANMPGLRLGWRCWVGGKVIDDRTELLIDMLPVPPRADLGDHDKGLWELDDRYEPRDPWVMTYSVELADQATGETFLFSTTSTGGVKAIGRLLKNYGNEYRMRPGQLPVIELQRDSYMHSNKAYGKIYVPEFPIVGWIDDGAAARADAYAHDRPSSARSREIDDLDEIPL